MRFKANEEQSRLFFAGKLLSSPWSRYWPKVMPVGFPGKRFARLQTVNRSQLLAGMPRVRLRLLPIGELSVTRPTIFVGVGVQRAGRTSIEVANDRITPIRGAGGHELDLAGLGVRLEAGDSLLRAARAMPNNPVQVTGEVAVPLME